MQLYVWPIVNISAKKFLCWTIGVNWTHSQFNCSPQLLIPVTKRGTLCTAAANQKHFQAMTILTRPDNAQSTPATLCSLGPVGKVSDEAHRCTTAVDWPIPFQARPNQLSLLLTGYHGTNHVLYFSCGSLNDLRLRASTILRLTEHNHRAVVPPPPPSWLLDWTRKQRWNN